MKSAKLTVLVSLVVFVLHSPVSVLAEESSTGHYTPGLNASFIDALPGKTGLAASNYFSYYHGTTDVSKTFPVGGFVTAGLNATVCVDTLAALYRTPLNILGGYYVTGVAVPYIWMTVKGDVQLTGPGGTTITRSKRDTANGFGDITVFPVMLGWSALGGDLKYDFRMGIYIPTGEFEKNKLANVGKNYWTFEPMVTVSYLSSKTGLELSMFAGLDFNTRNNETDYATGNEFHLDMTAAEHIPLFGGLIGIGVDFFYYDQIGADKGSGAVLGDQKGRTVGIGPVLSYISKFGLVAEVKWLPEIDVTNRTKGDYIWFKLAMQF